MRKFLTLSLAATTAISAVAFSTAASAYDYGSYRNHYSSRHDNNDVAGAAIAAGVIGLVLGAALASSSNDHHSYYDNGYYNRGYSNYGGGYGSYGYSQPYYGSGYGSYGGGYGYGQQPYYGGGYGYQRCYTTRSWDPYYGDYVSHRVCR